MMVQMNRYRAACDDAAAATDELVRKGFTIEGIKMDESRVTIKIAHHSACNQLVRDGIAAYYITYSQSGGKKYRCGQFYQDKCRVIWKEQNY